MNVEQFQQWKDDPLTLLFMQYLRDYRQDLMERWAQGSIVEPSEQLMAIARCQVAEEITTLDDNSVSEFYRKQKGIDHVPADQETGR